MSRLLCSLVLATLLPLGLAGCPRNRPPASSGSTAEPAGEVPPGGVDPRVDASAPDGLQVGGDRMGFVEGWTATGRFAFVRRWEGDPDDPEAFPIFGHHGFARPAPRLTVFDTVSGQEREAAELIEISGDGAWALVLAEGSTWLLSDADGSWEDLGADPTPDLNACLPPRAAAFGAPGQVAWVVAEPQRLMMRDLDTGEESAAEPEGLLWRGFPLGGGAAVLLEVEDPEAGFPLQNTSCDCRWCNRFARSYGVYGWTGTWRSVRVDADGTRSEVDGVEIPPGERAPWPCSVRASGDLDGRVERGPWLVSCEGGRTGRKVRAKGP